MSGPRAGTAVIASACVLPYRLPLVRPWDMARGTRRARRGWLLRLETGDAVVGYGDCAPWEAIGTESFGAARARLREAVSGTPGQSLEAAMDRVSAWQRTPAARCALETALLDILAQMAGRPLAAWLKPRAADRVRVNRVLGALDAVTGDQVRQAAAEGYGVLKLKLGCAQPRVELEALRRLATQLPVGVSLRLDANRAWNSAQAMEFVSALHGLPVESLEEPLSDPDPAALARLGRAAGFPLALDESLARLDPDTVLRTRCVQRLVLKPMVLGGLRPALALARRAEAAGLECVATTTVDSAAGVFAAAHLAACLPGGRHHGLATAEWLVRDLGSAPVISRGWLVLGSGPGLGFRPRAGFPGPRPEPAG